MIFFHSSFLQARLHAFSLTGERRLVFNAPHPAPAPHGPADAPATPPAGGAPATNAHPPSFWEKAKGMIKSDTHEMGWFKKNYNRIPAFFREPISETFSQLWHGVRTAWQAGKSVAYANAAPLWHMGTAPIAHVKRTVLDSPLRFIPHALALPFNAVKTLCWRLPIALARSPLELAYGVRDALVSLPKNLGDLTDKLLDLKLRGSIQSARKTLGDFFVPPVKRPGMVVARSAEAPAKNVLGMGAAVAYPFGAYTNGLQNAWRSAKEGWTGVWNAGAMAGGGHAAESHAHAPAH